MAERERRVIGGPVEARQDGDVRQLSGYAAVFNTVTDIAGLFREQIAPGAFTEAVTRDDVRALFNHDANFVLGRTASGTLSLREDAQGLRYDVTPPSTTWATDLMVSVSRGDITQSSFAFSVDDESWEYPAGVLPLRTIRKATLYDVSPVTYPAYASTSVSARAVDAAKPHELSDDAWRVDVERSRERCRWIDATTR